MILVSQCQASSKQPIYFVAAAHKSWKVFQVNSDGTDLKQTLMTEYDVLKVSTIAKGKKLLFISSNQKIFLFDLKTREKTEIIAGMTGIVDGVLSIDNKSLLFSLSTGGSNDANHIWKVNLKGKKITQLTHMKERQYDPIWSHDDSSIFFVSGAGRQNYDIWRLDIKEASLNQLTAGQLYNFEPSCSQNDEIAFSSNRSGDYEIWSMDPFGGNVRQLTHSPGMDSQPAWSPDGEQLVFVSNRNGHPALYITDRAGKKSRRLSPEGLICRNPVWSR